MRAKTGNLNKLTQISRIYFWPTIILNTLAVSFFCKLSFPESISLSIIICLLASYGFVVNDILDRKIDRINKANRLENSSRNQMFLALASGFIFLFSAFCLTLSLNRKAILITFFLAVLLTLYSLYLRRILFLATFCSAFVSISPIWAPFVVGGVKATPYHQYLILAAFAFIFSRETMLDLKDLKGDLAGRRQTISSVFGSRVAVIVTALLTVFTLAIIMFAVNFESNLHFFVKGALTILFLFTSYFLVLNPFSKYVSSQRDLKLYIVRSRIFMLSFPVLLLLG